MKLNMSIILPLFVFIIVIIFILITYNRIESFQTSKNNIYTYDSCCNENDIANCEKYGKTGVCNYVLNDNSCMCQNAI